MKKRMLCAVSAIFLLLGLGGCGSQMPKSDTLVIGTQNFDGKFSPFFYTGNYDSQVLDLVHQSLLETDREGAVVYRGIEGETRPFNGTDYTYRGIADCDVREQPDGSVIYDITLRRDVLFSDGHSVDIDDVIFSMYVALDPDYDGTMTFYSLPILGLEDYRAGQASRVAGIEKTGSHSLRLTMTELSATAIYTLAGLPVAPLHYYGDQALYDYEQDRFGFESLEQVRAVTAKPMGAGPYRFVSYSGGTVSLEASDHYWKGKPQISRIQFREGQDADKVPGVVAGTLDVASPSYSVETAKAIENANGGSIDGDTLTTRLVANPGYGYVGINAKNVKVGQDAGSEESKNLRKALATVIAVYRDVAVDSYYGDYAQVIHYPISSTSWAAPRVTDEDYRVAFSLDVEGQPIYDASMDAQTRYEKASQAALGFFEGAGYTVEDGRVTAAPEGASMTYEVLVSGGGTGDHPTFMALTMASAALRALGFRLIVTDLSNFSELSSAVNGGTAELFAMAWAASEDPDMYQIYHSQGPSNEKSYHLKDEALDALILLARSSTDQTYRRTLYKSCLEIIADWAVEIPMYQRQNAVIFSSRRIDVNTLTPDMTTFWSWEKEIEKLVLR